MPVYEYACEKCNHEFEAEQRISDDPIRTCPKCRARKVKRLISRTSFVLKGGGWYSDLYSSKSKSESSQAESASDAKPAKESKDSTSPDTQATTPSQGSEGPGGSGGGKKGKKKSEPKAAA